MSEQPWTRDALARFKVRTTMHADGNGQAHWWKEVVGLPVQIHAVLVRKTSDTTRTFHVTGPQGNRECGTLDEVVTALNELGVPLCDPPALEESTTP